MSLNHGNSAVTDVFVGSEGIKNIYAGNSLVWQRRVPATWARFDDSDYWISAYLGSFEGFDIIVTSDGEWDLIIRNLSYSQEKPEIVLSPSCGFSGTTNVTVFLGNDLYTSTGISAAFDLVCRSINGTELATASVSLEIH